MYTFTHRLCLYGDLFPNFSFTPFFIWAPRRWKSPTGLDSLSCTTCPILLCLQLFAENLVQKFHSFGPLHSRGSPLRPLMPIHSYLEVRYSMRVRHVVFRCFHHPEPLTSNYYHNAGGLHGLPFRVLCDARHVRLAHSAQSVGSVQRPALGVHSLWSGRRGTHLSCSSSSSSFFSFFSSPWIMEPLDYGLIFSFSCPLTLVNCRGHGRRVGGPSSIHPQLPKSGLVSAHRVPHSVHICVHGRCTQKKQFPSDRSQCCAVVVCIPSVAA